MSSTLKRQVITNLKLSEISSVDKIGRAHV